MNLQLLDPEFTIGKLSDFSKVDFQTDFTFLAKTDEEHSIVCPSGSLPENILEAQSGFRAFRIDGILDLSMVGVLSRIASCLADHRIAIFVVSTFDTDIILVKSQQLADTMHVLAENGYHWV